MDATGEITRLLDRMGEPGAESAEVLDELMPLVYGELKTLAHNNRYRWHGRLSSGTTSLVHEAYARLARGEGAECDTRSQFFALASRVMRSILIDNARWHSRQKRGGAAVPVSTSEVQMVSAERSEELLALDEALGRLETDRPDLARVVECRVFGGLTIPEASDALGVSPATIKRRWSLATAWLYRQLQEG
ncbi:MAG TPA: ECF-type sigma factor [Acidimicrobiia bacterium]|nr:ECF-type sigma factor [Acidimicrobiia bacterium]